MKIGQPILSGERDSQRGGLFVTPTNPYSEAVLTVKDYGQKCAKKGALLPHLVLLTIDMDLPPKWPPVR